MANKDFDEIIDDVIEDLKNGNFKKKIIESINHEKIEKDLKEIADNVIDEFYNDKNFKRKMYKPTGSLKTAYEVKRKKDEFVEVNLDDKNLLSGEHRVSNEYIYDKVFVEGWHGGAFFKDTKMMMYPVGINANKGVPYNGDGGKPYNREPDKPKSYGWKPAQKGSFSPKEKINDMATKYYKDNAKDIVSDAFEKVEKEYGL